MKKIGLIFSLLVFGVSFSQDQIVFTQANNNTAINTCNGFIIDSGGQGGPGYTNNENVTITICPDTIGSGNNTDFINIVFSLFNLDVTDLDPANNSSDQDILYVYDGPNTGSPSLGNYTGTALANSTIQATNLNPSGCITLQFVSNGQNAAGNWFFTASATCATPCDSPFADAELVNGITLDSINVCVGQSVDFLENGSYAQPNFNLVTYEWDFMDGNTAVGSQGGTVSHSFDNPGQYLVNLIVTDDNADEVCQNANLTQIAVYVATPPTFYNFPQDTTLCIGEDLVLLAQPTFFDSTWSGFPGTTSVEDGCLSDTLIGVAQEIELMQTGFNAGASITNVTDIVSICLDMEHTYIGDLVIQIECPNGQLVTLHQQGGGGTDLGVPVQGSGFNGGVDCINGLNQGTPFTYCFTPIATDTWVEWVANNGGGGSLPAGDYESVGDLNGLVGCPLNGWWTLIVTDLWGADDGTVFGMGLNFANYLYPDIVTFTPAIGEQSDSSFWDPTDPFITNITGDANEITITPTVDGIYTYTYTAIDNYGCTNDSIVTVTVDPPIIITAGIDTAVCDGQIVVIGPEVAQCVNDGGNYTYCYGNNENTVFTYCPDNPGDGLTFMQIFFNAGSAENGWDDITVYDGPDANAPLIGVFDGDLTGLVFTATNAGGCITMVLSTDGSVSCTSGSQTMWDFDVSCGGGGNVTYVWTPNDGSLDNVNIPNPTVINPVNTTTYTLSVFPTGHPQCATSDDVVVSIGGGLDAGDDSTIVLCFEGLPEDLYNYLGGAAQLGGIWFNPAGQQIVMPIQPDTIADGVYEYLRDSAGCFVSAFITVSVNQLTVSAVIDHSDCNAFNGEVQLLAINTLGPIQYSNDAGVTFQAGDTFVGGMGFGNSYNFMVQDSVGCIAIIDTIVIDDSFPVIDVNSIVLTDSDCSLDNGEVVSVTTNGGTANYTYSVDGAVYQALVISNLAPNTFDLIVQDNFGCTDTTEITISEINAPLITDVIATDVSCYNLNDGTIEIIGDNLQSFSIDNGVSYQNSNIFNGIIPGTYNIIAASGPNGTLCAFTWVDQIIIIEPTALQIDTLSSDMIVCIGDEVTIGVLGSGGNGNYTYDWGGLGSSSSVTFEVNVSVQVCVTMSEDCPSPTVTECLNITTSPSISPLLETSDREGCYPLESTFINITNNPAVASSVWSFSDNESEINVVGSGNIDYTFQNAGTFDVSLSIVSVAGCVYDTTYSQYITVYNHPNANYSYTPIPMTVYDTEAQFVDYSTGEPIVWEWDFGSGAIPLTSLEQNPLVQYPTGVATTYMTSLHVYNEFGCEDSMFVQVEVINDVLIFVPNVFTPDGDSYNETWRVFISGVDIYDFHCTVFNRWGEIVWESYNVDGEWDGTYAGGNQVQDGTYVWVVYANDLYDDKKYEFRGTVNILR